MKGVRRIVSLERKMVAKSNEMEVQLVALRKAAVLHNYELIDIAIEEMAVLMGTMLLINKDILTRVTDSLAS